MTTSIESKTQQIIVRQRERERGQFAVYYFSPQSFIKTHSYSLAEVSMTI